MGFEKVFGKLTFKRIDAKMVPSLVDYVLYYCFWTNAILSKFDNDSMN